MTDVDEQDGLQTYHLREDLSESEWDEWRGALQEKYRFYIMNPERERGVNYSLWVREDGFEYPVMNSNTGGFVTFNSRSEQVGDGIPPTEEFLQLVGTGFHEAMCFMPDLYFREEFETSVERVYGGNPREYEVWAAHVLISWIASPGVEIPELLPLAHWAGAHTKFGVPILGESAAGDTGDDDGE